jgi:hypothetical protein
MYICIYIHTYIYNNNNTNKRTFKDTAAVSRPRLQKRCTMLSTKDTPAAEIGEKIGGKKDEEEEKKEVPVFIFWKEERREGRVEV